MAYATLCLEKLDPKKQWMGNIANEKVTSLSNEAILVRWVAGVEKPVECTRCHSLRYYGKVKDPTVENLLPDFDFDYTIGRRLALTGGTRSVVLMVVDSSNFDGSFPRKVAKLVSATIEENHKAWKKESLRICREWWWW
ncbi:hypothetical protein FH972_005683 [Carpinus fangiana]|uniref:Uncharacterized protein n=1 Tax=Carpinus fangiana TaxID=176857 RepID=A0A5N6QQD0_9ROSI|nr:hypothetical protein FH972_005683 [Carpinus fangiana]